MKLDQTEKGALIASFGALLTVFAGIPYEDIRIGTSTLAQSWEPILFWLTLSGLPIVLVGGWTIYSMPMLSHK